MRDIYTSPEVASETIRLRQTDSDVLGRVLEYLGDDLPSSELITDNPVAISARYVPRATFEDLDFYDQASQADLQPFWASYLDDKFTVRSAEKVATIRPPILLPKGQRTRSWVVETDKRQGGIGTLETVYQAEDGVDGAMISSAQFQQNIRQIVMDSRGLSDGLDKTFDMSAWYRRQAVRFGYEQGSKATYYYPALMALATSFCVLYEDYDDGPSASNGDLAKFTDGVLYPAIQKVQQDLELKPLIVRLPYRPGMGDTDLSFMDAEEVQNFQQNGQLKSSSLVT